MWLACSVECGVHHTVIARQNHLFWVCQVRLMRYTGHTHWLNWIAKSEIEEHTKDRHISRRHIQIHREITCKHIPFQTGFKCSITLRAVSLSLCVCFNQLTYVRLPFPCCLLLVACQLDIDYVRQFCWVNVEFVIQRWQQEC